MKRAFVGLCLLLTLAATAFTGKRTPAATAAAPGQAMLRPGLIVAATNPGVADPQVQYAIDPTVALFLRDKESVHPELLPAPLTVKWKGNLKILRADDYRFGVNLRGLFRLRVNGKEVLAADVKEAQPQWRLGAPVALAAGTFSFEAEFVRHEGLARVQLWWQAKHFHPEPLPHDAVGYEPGETPLILPLLARRERGRLLVEEHSCTSCHAPQPDDGLARSLRPRPGPTLSDVGGRVKESWLHAWLRDPAAVRAHALMPKLFTDDEPGRAGAYAVARFLSTLGGPYREPADKANPNDRRTSAARGQRLFGSVGCTVCHTAPPQQLDDSGVKVPLAGLGGKTGVAALARFLQYPHATHPAGRMPSMLLTPAEATDLARYLCQDGTDRPLPAAPPAAQARRLFDAMIVNDVERTAFAKLPEADQWIALGRRLAVEKGCTNCHALDVQGKPLERRPARSDFTTVRQQGAEQKGCLDAKHAPDKHPAFVLTTAQRDDLRAFLAGSRVPAAAAAPSHEAKVALQRHRCLDCHSKDGQHGLSADAVDALRQFENTENAEAVVPPPLTSIGTKLQTAWMHRVLTQGGRARPWMALRMPQFGEGHVGKLAEGLAALDGVDPVDHGSPPPFASDVVGVGRQLVGKKAFGCIACHDIAGNAAGGTRGPDLAFMQDRVRYDWYRRWLEQPQKMQPSTRMPTIFTNGRSQIDDVLGGKADAQAAAMWTYLSLGPSLPLPEGTEPPPGLTLVPTDRPIVLRTFMPDAGAKAIAVGFPDQVAAAYDASTCRVAYAWAGNFLDASPVWNNRGGAPAKVLGTRFLTGTEGFPWAFRGDNERPDFAAQARDPAYGAKLPEGQLFTGAAKLHFEGYQLGKQGQPEFRYRVDVGDKAASIVETIQSDRRPAAVGLARRYAVRTPAKQSVWLLVAQSTQTPRLLDAKGAALPFRLDGEPFEEPANVTVILGPPEKPVVFGLRDAPAGTAWILTKREDKWHVLVRLPRPEAAGELLFSLFTWQPYRNEPGLIRELLAKP
jgi:cbb3-type cytochrome oxidase cytochrome c subunit